MMFQVSFGTEKGFEKFIKFRNKSVLVGGMNVTFLVDLSSNFGKKVLLKNMHSKGT